ncbi:hypothetical protein [Paraburkholderia pallida]|uniref:Uncharacterized protein n=1 Tax=Paraburkholderia pallida TaxID=2547399 RepID=A0A4P7CQT5_9BURK|nr:hypothetical protein [Paraburkholderia pallida]QBQ98230.1 hypothetical protein E1956_14315 [Paraburkholderia pallida]
MLRKPTFPSGYTHEELGSEIARLLNLPDLCQARFERMSDLAEAVDQIRNNRKRLKRTSRLIELAKQAATAYPESTLAHG